jgi:5'-3' exonuclease
MSRNRRVVEQAFPHDIAEVFILTKPPDDVIAVGVIGIGTGAAQQNDLLESLVSVGVLDDAHERRNARARGGHDQTFAGLQVAKHQGAGGLRRLERAQVADRYGVIVRMIVHLIDGTYELFRHFYGLRRFTKGADRPFGAVLGVLNGVLQMIEEGATHLGVATDHVIESFRNELWSGYKTGDGIEPALRAQFQPLEEALEAMGVAVWPMIELEADDALASAAAIAAGDVRVQKVCIWTPDKDLAQCVRADRVVQVDRKTKSIRDADGVRAKFGVSPELIADYLALVGDSADGYPGISGIGPKGAASLLTRFGKIEDFPVDVLGERRELALKFKLLATLRTDAALFADVDSLKWVGPVPGFRARCEQLGDTRVAGRAEKAAAARPAGAVTP